MNNSEQKPQSCQTDVSGSRFQSAYAQLPLRLADEFKYGQFRNSVAKYVRPEFRQAVNDAHGHWISKKI